jgi:glycosyltransferase involved in cell wall biosynthesis
MIQGESPSRAEPGNRPPLVSVGVPVYNGAEFVAEALQSVLAQDYPNLELIVCDNASEDETEAICRRIAASDNRVRYLRNPVNIELVSNFQRTLDEARGRYFSWLAHDDVMSDPAYLRTVVSYLEEHPDVVACATAFRLLNSQFAFAGDVIQFPELTPERWPASMQMFFRWPHGWEGLVVYGLVRTGGLRRSKLPQRTHKGRPHIFWWETDVVTALCRLGRIVALPGALRSYRLAVTTAGTGLSTSVSTFDLYRIGLRMKLILIGRASRMPGPRPARVRLVATAVANLFRANRGQPYDHAFVRRNWEVAVAALQRSARERREVVETLCEAIQQRREVLVSLGFDPGPEPELPAPPEPVQAEAMAANLSGSTYSRSRWVDFFQPPAGWQIEAGQRLQAAVGSLNLVCRDLAKTIETLNSEAKKLEALLESAVPRS